MTLDIKSIRARAGLSLAGLLRVLRMKNKRTLRRWDNGEEPPSGPASIVLEMIDQGELPERYYIQGHEITGRWKNEQ